jgi:hypothetical protein
VSATNGERAQTSPVLEFIERDAVINGTERQPAT